MTYADVLRDIDLTVREVSDAFITLSYGAEPNDHSGVYEVFLLYTILSFR